jgi:hypothetical protein
LDANCYGSADDEPEAIDHGKDQPERVAHLRMLHESWAAEVTTE